MAKLLNSKLLERQGTTAPDVGTVWVPKDLQLQIKALSRTDGRRMKWHVAKALEEYLARVEKSA